MDNQTDCDDSSSAINPGASETCDGTDNDCDGTIDENSSIDASTWYFDGDEDGYGGATGQIACVQPANYVTNSTDCNDGDSSIHPSAAESCDAVDSDCDGLLTDGANGSTWYADADADGYGNGQVPVTACWQSAGIVASSNDCNDAVATINPGATEVCDDVDNNCDGQTDESGASVPWYRDADSDGYGNSTKQ